MRGCQKLSRHSGARREVRTSHGFDEFYGNLYHLNAEEEPEDPDYPKFPGFHISATETNSCPLFIGKVKASRLPCNCEK
jgi:arylsulfatase A-like enzyme